VRLAQRRVRMAFGGLFQRAARRRHSKQNLRQWTNAFPLAG
jgi:hypothetical protein